MTLLARTTARASRVNRERQARAELRLSEIIKVAGIADEYEQIDRAGDLAMETWFARAYQAADSEPMRTLIAQGFVVWQRTEQAEEQHVRGDVDDSVEVLKANNPTWLGEGAQA